MPAGGRGEVACLRGEEFIDELDLAVGRSVHVWGRKIALVGCDLFTIYFPLVLLRVFLHPQNECDLHHESHLCVYISPMWKHYLSEGGGLVQAPGKLYTGLDHNLSILEISFHWW